jgi:hypothetical protein
MKQSNVVPLPLPHALEHLGLATSILSMDAEMAILIQQLQTNVHLPAVDFTMEQLPLVSSRGVTSSRTLATAWPVTPTAGNVWVLQTLSVSLVATRTTIY